MPFATRADLLKLINVQKLAQLAVPTDQAMPDEDVLRVAISEGDLTQFTEHDNHLVELALANIDQALIDATALIVAHGIAETVQSTLITRMCAQIAYYLLAAGSESITDQRQEVYNGIITQLKQHARGEISLVPAEPSAEPIVGDVIEITSNQQRYVSIDPAADEDDF